MLEKIKLFSSLPLPSPVTTLHINYLYLVFDWPLKKKKKKSTSILKVSRIHRTPGLCRQELRWSANHKHFLHRGEDGFNFVWGREEAEGSPWRAGFRLSSMTFIFKWRQSGVSTRLLPWSLRWSEELGYHAAVFSLEGPWDIRGRFRTTMASMPTLIKFLSKTPLPVPPSFEPETILGFLELGGRISQSEDDQGRLLPPHAQISKTSLFLAF